MKVIASLVLIMAAAPAALPASDFDGLVREFSRQTGAHRLYIPFIGLAQFVVAVAHPAGTSEFKLAVFENADAQFVDLARMTDGFVSGEGWNRIIRVKKRNGDSTNVYMQPAGNRVRMLVTVLEARQATFVQMKIHPEELETFVNEHRGHATDIGWKRTEH